MVVLGGDVAEHGFAHWIQVTVGVEEPHHSFGLLERLNQAVQENAIEAPIRETNAIVVMLVEGVHGLPPGLSNPEEYVHEHPYEQTASATPFERAPEPYNGRGARSSPYNQRQPTKGPS